MKATGIAQNRKHMFKMRTLWLLYMQEVILLSIFGNLILPIGTKPASGWVKWFHNGVPDEEGETREQARKVAKKQRHCENCTVLSGCYFPSFNMSRYPQHPYCDCKLFSIPKPTSQARAYCDIRKFTEYVFKPSKKENETKTELFTLLGFTIEDSNYLKSELEKQALVKYLNGDYVLGLHNERGQRITIDVKLKSSKKDDILLRTGWMIRPLGYITCNTPLGDR